MSTEEPQPVAAPEPQPEAEGLGAYLVLIVSGLFVPIIAVIGFLGIALYYIIPFRRLSASFMRRTRRRQRHRR
jgi:hypothetical protein